MRRVSKEPRQTTIVPLGDNKLVGILVTSENHEGEGGNYQSCEFLDQAEF